jgi:hypothetical protein
MFTRRTRGRSRGGATLVPVPGPEIPPGGGGGGGGETANNLDFNFATNVYTVGAASTALASQFSTTRASSMQAERVDGGFDTIASGIVARTDLGLTRSDSTGGVDDNLVPSNNMTGAVAGSPGTGPTDWQFPAQGTGGLTRTLATGALGDGTGRNYLDITFSGTGTGAAILIYLETGGETVAASTAYKQSIECAITAGSFANFTQARLACDFWPTYTWGGETSLLSATSTLTKYERTGNTSASDSNIVGMHLTFTATGAVNVTLRIVQPYFGINGSVTTAGAAETLTAAGDLLTLLRATTGSLFVEFHQATANPLDGSGITGKIITGGAAGAITMLGLYGASSVMCTPITAAASGGGGCMGMARAMIMWDGSQTRMVFNGGEVSTGAAFASRTGNPCTFLEGLNCYIRRIIGWNTLQTDAFAQTRTALTYDDFGSNSPGSLTLYGRTRTFTEEWTNFTYGGNIRYLPDTAPTNAKYQIPGKWKSTMHYYDNESQGRHGMYYGGNRGLLFRWDDPAFVALGYRNLDIVANDAGQTSALRWRLEHRSQWPAGVVSLIDGGTIPEISGRTIDYLCPMLSTHQEPDTLNNGIGFSQDAGVWEFRVKFPPKAKQVWPGVWTMCDNGWPPEWDFIERFGYNYGNGFTHTVHWPRGGNTHIGVTYQPAVDMANDYHVLTYIQTGHVFDCYIDGKYHHTIDITNQSPAPDFTGRRQYWIISGGVSDDSVGWIDGVEPGLSQSTPVTNDMYFDWFKNYS